MSKSTLTQAIVSPRQVSRDRTTKLLVAWQNPIQKFYLLIGSVAHHPSEGVESFEFKYRENVATKKLFHPIPGFDDVDQVYRSSRLFPFLAGRLMSDSRPDRGRWLDSMGATQSAGPFEILSQSFGIRANDTYELFAEPTVDDSAGTLIFHVLVHGTRYQKPEDMVQSEIASLNAEDLLAVVPEPDNERDERAHAVLGPSGRRFGYVPAPVLDYILESGPISGRFTAKTLRVNPESLGTHMRLVMRLTYHSR